ncbi:hypothetical protein [Mycobacterium sp. E3298]|uniref:hypothetical protein n=1 Tax=Mycobacterium sp. E3298 TaxID=1856865 RepID=UPI0012EA0007|nr:hypothetical protein [Mycobacterium sp. E3298]
MPYDKQELVENLSLLTEEEAREVYTEARRDDADPKTKATRALRGYIRRHQVKEHKTK